MPSPTSIEARMNRKGRPSVFVPIMIFGILAIAGIVGIIIATDAPELSNLMVEQIKSA